MFLGFRFTWTYPTFFLGVSSSHQYGFHSIGFGLVSLTYDRFYNDAAKKGW